MRANFAGAALTVLLAASSSAKDMPFTIVEIPVDDRAVQADLADLDGDGRGDLLWISLRGFPPHEEREIRVHYQRMDGSFAPGADWRKPLPEGVAGYDLASLDADPGVELVLLRRDGVEVLSLSGRLPSMRHLTVPAPPTLAATTDERGVDRLRMVRDGLGDGPRLLVPGFGETTVLAPSGEVLGRLRAGARANYFLPPRPGPVIAESEMEIYFDHPRLSVGDVDGDGRGDVIASNRHELRVFLQRGDGSFASNPDRHLALGRLRPEDHIRSGGSVRVDLGDFDGDGRVDLLVTSSEGGFFDAKTESSVHLNRDGSWDLDSPDQVFASRTGLTSRQVLDLDGDGWLELVSAEIPTSVLELVEVLLTRAIDAEFSIHRHGEDVSFDPEPWQTRKLDIGMSFETFRPLGFIPTLEADFNGDGHRDFTGSGDGDELEIHLGSREDGFRRRHAVQPLDTAGRIRFGDLEGDGLSDFLIYDPRRQGAPIRIGANRGVLPGTRMPTPARRPAPTASTPGIRPDRPSDG